MARMTLSNLTKVYSSGVKAVSNFNLEIDDAEFLVLLGPSDCGKSTILRMIAGLEEITEGDVCFDGRSVRDLEPKSRDIAMVFKSHALYPHMTAYNIMAFGLKQRRIKKKEIEQRIMETAGMLGIEELLHKKPEALSADQRLRVDIGRAIVRKPKVILMDDPLFNLSTMLRARVCAEILRLYQKLKITFVYATREQTEAMNLGTRIVVIKDGEIQQTDSRANLYKSPANLFVAGFVGSPQMNFIETTVFPEGDSVSLSFENFKIAMDAARGKVLVQGGYAGKKVILGIRPQDIDIMPVNAPVKARIKQTELFGMGMHLHLQLGDISVLACTASGFDGKIGSELGINIDSRKVHVFDIETENSVV